MSISKTTIVYLFGLPSMICYILEQSMTDWDTVCSLMAVKAFRFKATAIHMAMTHSKRKYSFVSLWYSEVFHGSEEHRQDLYVNLETQKSHPITWPNYTLNAILSTVRPCHRYFCISWKTEPLPELNMAEFTYHINQTIINIPGWWNSEWYVKNFSD